MLSPVEGKVNPGNAYCTFVQPLLDWMDQADAQPRERMERSPRRYVASCASIESLDVRPSSG